MSELKLFKLAANQVTELSVSCVALKKLRQTLIEKYLDAYLGISFLNSESSTALETIVHHTRTINFSAELSLQPPVT